MSTDSDRERCQPLSAAHRPSHDLVESSTGIPLINIIIITESMERHNKSTLQLIYTSLIFKGKKLSFDHQYEEAIIVKVLKDAHFLFSY